MLPGRAVAAASDTVLHFSYGANMASGILAKRGVKPLASRPAVLTEPATMISFCHRGGFATLVKQPLNGRDEADPRVQRTDVHGVLHTLARADMAALQRAETGYTLQPISVRPYQRGTELVLSNHAPGGASRTEKSVELPLVSHAKSFSEDDVLASAFVSRPVLQLRSPVAPTGRYLELMQAGAREHGLDPGYVAWLASVPSVGRSGLPPEYFDTGPNVVAQGFLVIVGVAFLVIFLRH